MALRGAGRVDLRTRVAGIDPGLTRLRLASIAVAAMMLAAGVTAVLRSTVARGEPVTVVLFSGVLAMISNLVVNETDLVRQRVTTALMVLPAAATTVAGTLLSPYRIVADTVFVLIMIGAVWIRRYGPRGFALGMAGFMPFFFTQFLHTRPDQLPWLLVAVLTGLGATLLLRGVVFAERPERTLRRLVTAFRGRAHALVQAVDAVFAALAEHRGDPGGGEVDEGLLEGMRRGRSRLNEVALLVEDQLEQATASRVWPGLDNETLALRVFDAELALERLAVSARRLVRPPGGGEGDQRPDTTALVALRAGLARLQAALASGARHDDVLTAAADARGAVAGLVAHTHPGHERVQRAAFGVRRVADAVHHAQEDAPGRRGPRPLARSGASGTGKAVGIAGDGREHEAGHDDARPESRARGGAGSDGTRADGGPGDEASNAGTPASGAPDSGTRDGESRDGGDQDGGNQDGESRDDVDRGDVDRGDRTDPAGSAGPPRAGDDRGLPISTRQAVQVGVATTLAIVAGELLAPTRWYWAVVTAFVVFAGTQSRGDLLSRGWGRVLGTIGGVAAGMGLGALVAGDTVPSLVLMSACAFMALYLVRVSPALLAFWITAVLALVYGLIGRFSVEVLLLRVEETVIGAVASVLAAFLVLPKGTRTAFGEAVEDLVDTMDIVLDGAVDQLVGRTPRRRPRDLAREMDDALATLRQRARPLVGPTLVTGTTLRRRTRSGHRRGLRVLVGCDHYVRHLARLAEGFEGPRSDPAWADTIRPAAARVRANLDALRDLLVRGRRRSDGERVRVVSAEPLVDAAEAYAARSGGEHPDRSGGGGPRDPRRRTEMLTAARLLRRVDQAVVGLAVDLGAADDVERAQEPSTEASSGLANTRSGS